MEELTGPSGARPGRVLLVEDDDAVRRAFQLVLARHGHDVVTAGDAEEAFAAVDRNAFDVIVSDIRLPGMSGVDLLRAVRQHDLDVPVILMTGWPQVDTATQAVELGAMQYLRKPVRPAELSEVVQRAVRLHAIARAKREALAVLGESEAKAGDRAGLMTVFERTLEGMRLVFQPIVHAASHEVFAYEALLRGGEPTMRKPEDVLETAERLGRLPELGQRTRELASASLPKLPEDSPLFINLRARDLLHHGLSSAAAPLSRVAHRVVLEITEREAVEDIEDLRGRVARLREMGYRLALDDLGAGYAGLNSFALLEPEFVKLDRTLIQDCHDSEIKQRVVGSMAQVCREMRVEVIAEGVEREEEAATAERLGCDYLQGYLFGRPARR